MIIVNKENIFTNQQIVSYIKLLGDGYNPDKIIIYESRLDFIRYLFKKHFIVNLVDVKRVVLGKINGRHVYYNNKCVIEIFIFSQNEHRNLHNKQMCVLHTLTHELRHKWQKCNNVEMCEDDADTFATNFINENSAKISRIMKWKDEWEVEEE